MAPEIEPKSFGTLGNRPRARGHWNWRASNYWRVSDYFQPWTSLSIAVLVPFCYYWLCPPQNLDAIRAKGAALVESLSSYTNLWHSNRSSTKQRLLTAPGDALVTAAAVCYFGPLLPDAREELFSDWLRACDGTTRKPKQPLLSLSSVILRDKRDEDSTGNCECKGTNSNVMFLCVLYTVHFPHGRIRKWQLSNFSFVFMLIILTGLVSTNDIQKNVSFKVRLGRMISTKTKE